MLRIHLIFKITPLTVLSRFNLSLQKRREGGGGIRGDEEGEQRRQQVRITVEYSFPTLNHVFHCILSLSLV